MASQSGWGKLVCVCASQTHVCVSAGFFFFFQCLWTVTSTVHVLCWNLCTVHGTCNHFIQKKIYIKNGFHSTIHIFKNYFVTVFFSFQLYPNGPLVKDVFKFWIIFLTGISDFLLPCPPPPPPSTSSSCDSWVLYLIMFVDVDPRWFGAAV